LSGEAVDRDGFASRLEWLDPRARAEGPGLRRRDRSPRDRDRGPSRRRGLPRGGADPDHLERLLAHAREAAGGRDVKYGAFVTAVVNDDVAVARDAVRGAAATFARFSAFRGSDLERLPAPLADAARHLREHYDMRDHTRADAAHARGLTDAFVDWFAVVGGTELARERFRRLAALGLDFCYVIPGSTGMPRDVAAESIVRLARDVIPAVRRDA
jgi:hypothetical protein